MNAKDLIFLLVVGVGLTAFPATMALRSIKQRTWWCLPLVPGIVAVLACVAHNDQASVYVFAGVFLVAAACFFSPRAAVVPTERSLLFDGQHFWAVLITIGILSGSLTYASLHRYEMQQDKNMPGVRVLDRWTGTVQRR